MEAAAQKWSLLEYALECGGDSRSRRILRSQKNFVILSGGHRPQSKDLASYDERPFSFREGVE